MMYLVITEKLTQEGKTLRKSWNGRKGLMNGLYPMVRHGSFKEVSTDDVDQKSKGEFLIQAEIEGTSAKDLNRSLLSALRRVEKRSRLRAEWSSGNTTERYFDYVLKKKTIKK